MGASPLQRCAGCLAVSASFLALPPVVVAPQLAKRTTTQASLGSNKAMRQLEVPQDLRKAIRGCSCTLAIAFALGSLSWGGLRRDAVDCLDLARQHDARYSRPCCDSER